MKINRDKMEELLLDYVDGRLSGDLKAFVETRIRKDAEIRSLYREYRELDRMMKESPEENPEDRLDRDFRQMLAQEKQLTESKVIPLRNPAVRRWVQVAASVVLVALGVLIGRSWVGEPRPDPELAAVKQDLEETKALLQQVLHGNLSASQRLKQVQVSYRLETADREILDALIRTMNTDDNVNVRIAAIRGLTGFTDDPVVRSALIQSLERQEDPFIQMMLINLLVRIQEKDAIKEFEKLIERESIDPTVKDEAQMGIFQLS